MPSQAHVQTKVDDVHIRDNYIIGRYVMGHEMSKEELLAMRIRQLKRRLEDLELALGNRKARRVKNKARFDKWHRL